jgi:hypothetical protein
MFEFFQLNLGRMLITISIIQTSFAFTGANVPKDHWCLRCSQFITGAKISRANSMVLLPRNIYHIGILFLLTNFCLIKIIVT